ncbi:MAG: hypothetical protein AUG44_07775 [Actinobacteria bacterium 13_1_20CM_3_71_11]|nr:MAG: hypothetical protein AUG44_07775 [Actinobacteria bacterium 13_1_20CM_3_71_11]
MAGRLSTSYPSVWALASGMVRVTRLPSAYLLARGVREVGQPARGVVAEAVCRAVAQHPFAEPVEDVVPLHDRRRVAGLSGS